MDIKQGHFHPQTAASKGLLVCSLCHQINTPDDTSCTRCGQSVSLRLINSVQQCLALLVTSLILFIPANLYPIMSTNLLGARSSSTIIGGVWLFIDHGSYAIAVIIFIASVIIPLAKIGALFVLCRATLAKASMGQKELMRLYRAVEFVGKWSMVDVFVVAILVGLVQLGSLTSIEPGVASVAFCGMVVLTIIAAQRFDPRLIWDRLEQ